MEELTNKIIYEINDNYRVDKHIILGVVKNKLNIRLKLRRLKDGALSNPDLLVNLNRFLFLERTLLIYRIKELIEYGR